MKFSTLSLCLLSIAGTIVQAVPSNNYTQAAASRQIDKWQKQYERYIEETIKTRKSGCTSDNIVYRREW